MLWDWRIGPPSWDCICLQFLNFCLKLWNIFVSIYVMYLSQTVIFVVSNCKIHLSQIAKCIFSPRFSVFLLFQNLVFCVVSVVSWVRWQLHLRWYHFNICGPWPSWNYECMMSKICANVEIYLQGLEHYLCNTWYYALQMQKVRGFLFLENTLLLNLTKHHFTQQWVHFLTSGTSVRKPTKPWQE